MTMAKLHLAAVAGVALLVLAAATHGSGAKRKNVLFLASDDFRYQLGVSSPGVIGPGCALMEGGKCKNMHTPNIDSLAAQSLMLHKNYVQQAVCSPTRTSLLTSRRPDATRVWDLYSYFRDVAGNYTTIPQLFRQQGYRTYGMGKIFHPGHASGAGSPNCPNCTKGDDAYWSWSEPYFHAPNEPYPLDGDDGNSSWLNVDPKTEAKYPLPDSQLADNAISIINKLAQEAKSTEDTEPFFLAVGFHRPHLPFVAPQAKYDLYPMDSIQLPARQVPPDGMPEIAWSSSGELVSYHDIKKIRNGTDLKPGETLPAKTVLELRRAYYAAVSHMDEQLGRVVDALKKSPFADDTIISFWGDHGWQLGELGEWCKHTNFELAVHAPMMIHVPGVTDKGISTMSYSEHIDLMPTLAEAAMDFTVPPCPEGKDILTTKLCTMGRSLVPLMEGKGPVNNASYSQYPRGAVTPHEDDVSAMTAAERARFFYEGEGSTPNPSACLKDHCTMGYTVVAVDPPTNKEYRFTMWVEFDGSTHEGPDWKAVVGRELYEQTTQGPEPPTNLVGDSRYTDVQSRMQALLLKGPPTGGAWGPYMAAD